MNATRLAAKEWETFRLVHNENGTVSLQAHDGHWVCAQNDERIMANRDSPDTWEQFEMKAYLGDGWRKAFTSVLLLGSVSIMITQPNGMPLQGTVQWHRNSAFPPWFTSGEHDFSKAGGNPFGANFPICEPYCDFWFKVGPDANIGVSTHGPDGKPTYEVCAVGGKIDIK